MDATDALLLATKGRDLCDFDVVRTDRKGNHEDRYIDVIATCAMRDLVQELREAEALPTESESVDEVMSGETQPLNDVLATLDDPEPTAE